jgi:hypothetical protein
MTQLTLTTALIAIGSAALAAEARADDPQRSPAARQTAIYEADQLWDEVFAHLKDDGDHWSRRRLK